jgi:cysteine desulfurase
MIYLDNNATTRIADEVFAAMEPFLRVHFGNPSSSHSAGARARRAVESAREQVAAMLNVSSPTEIAFTSGGTESDNWAILGALDARPGRDQIIATAVEHEAVRKLCERFADAGRASVTWLDVDESGAIDLDQLRDALTPRTSIVSVMMANNETGVTFPIHDIAAIVKEGSDAYLHVDAVNAAGKIALDVRSSEIDLLSISAHKFHGPKGVGALYIRNGVQLSNMLTGGGQEGGRRAGTSAVHQIVGLGAAAEFCSDLQPMNETKKLRDHLEAELLRLVPEVSVNGSVSHRLPNTSNLSFSNTNGEMVMHFLDNEGICVSTGSACNAADRSPSAVLQAMNVPYSNAMGSIRFSLGRFNTADEIDRVIDTVPRVIERVRSFSR